MVCPETRSLIGAGVYMGGLKKPGQEVHSPKFLVYVKKDGPTTRVMGLFFRLTSLSVLNLFFNDEYVSRPFQVSILTVCDLFLIGNDWILLSGSTMRLIRAIVTMHTQGTSFWEFMIS